MSGRIPEQLSAQKLFAAAHKHIQNKDFQPAIHHLDQARCLSFQDEKLRKLILFNLSWSLTQRNQQGDIDLAMKYTLQALERTSLPDRSNLKIINDIASALTKHYQTIKCPEKKCKVT